MASQAEERSRGAKKGAEHDEDIMYGHGPLSIEEINAKYPNRPHNHSQTMPFHELYLSLFNPLNDNKKRTGPLQARRKVGPSGPSNPNPNEARRIIIERFISRWRSEVGNDFYPALRLIIPEKDRDRAMYGLKEKAIGKILVKIMKINKNSDDASLLLNWKLPGNVPTSTMAGDFAGRCFEVLSKRPIRTTIGNMSIAEVNSMLDKLSAATKEDQQIPIFEEFYKNMCADELMWLVRIVLRQMKIGATEKTMLDVWHPDAEGLFNVSSSLRRVCWELADPDIRLADEQNGVALMECFQPQLAQFQVKSFEKMVANMRPTEEDPEFWIEEKLDGERMQMHMMADDDTPGGMRFGFWSRKAKDYTYLYGNGFNDANGSLTRHLKDAFHEDVQSLILDGEMITWDPEADTMVSFGTLKTAALSEQRNPFAAKGHRPLYRVFDILLLNGKDLTQYTLRERRKALEKVAKNVHRRFEKHEYFSATSADEIEPRLRKVVAESSEGLVLKNPRSRYRLNSRNDDWMKVKPEYMEEFGESLDCIVIGGYYGSGHRGGRLSSFLCGLRVDDNHVAAGADPQKCYSFFKVGGGFRAEDYANIRHHTENKWTDWNPKKPPKKYIELGGGDLQYERPDVWIKPEDSVVLSVKAASVGASDQFRTNVTIRFPRFKKLRLDKDWKSALSIREFTDIKSNVEEELKKKKAFKFEGKHQKFKKAKREIVIAGDSAATAAYAGPQTKLFEGLNFCVLSEALQPMKKTKGEIEEVIKANGGKIYQSPTARGDGGGSDDMICIADKKVVKVASLMKAGTKNVIRPKWIFDAVAQAEADSTRGIGERFIIPFEPTHMLNLLTSDEEGVNNAVDVFKDSYTRDVSAQELAVLLKAMPKPKPSATTITSFVQDLQHSGRSLAENKGWLFIGLKFFVCNMEGLFDQQKLDHKLAENILRFSGATIIEAIEDKSITHVLVDEDHPELDEIRETLSKRRRIPRTVTKAWVMESFKEGTLLDEERYVPRR